MSDWSMDFQPVIDEPSNMKPSSRKSALTTSAITVTCCSLPRGSVKRISTYSTPSSLIVLRTVSILMLVPLSLLAGGSDGVLAGLAGANTDDLFNRCDEDLAVADLVGARGGDDRFDGGID